jgi:hypothetical protein
MNCGNRYDARRGEHMSLEPQSTVPPATPPIILPSGSAFVQSPRP